MSCSSLGAEALEGLISKNRTEDTFVQPKGSLVLTTSPFLLVSPAQLLFTWMYECKCMKFHSNQKRSWTWCGWVSWSTSRWKVPPLTFAFCCLSCRNSQHICPKQGRWEKLHTAACVLQVTSASSYWCELSESDWSLLWSCVWLRNAPSGPVHSFSVPWNVALKQLWFKLLEVWGDCYRSDIDWTDNSKLFYEMWSKAASFI